MRNTRMLQKLLQIEKVHIFPILIIGLSIISNVIGQSFFPFVNYPLYTGLRMGEQYHFYGVQQGEGEMVYLPFRHYFFIHSITTDFIKRFFSKIIIVGIKIRERFV